MRTRVNVFATITQLACLTMAPLAARPHASARSVAVFAGGCYWGMESVFDHIQGVTQVVAGFAVPAGATAASTGHAGYAEAAQVTYDSTRITYHQLLQVFFAAHDPTEVDRQGPDEGPQYRSAIFVSDDGQRRAAQAFLDSLTAAHAYARPVVTEITTFGVFRAAPDQKFVKNHPNDAYVLQYDRPKLAALRQAFPALYRER